LYRLDENTSFDLIEISQFAVEHDLLATDEVDSPVDQFNGNGKPGGR